jgi:hypothetical protein
MEMETATAQDDVGRLWDARLGAEPNEFVRGDLDVWVSLAGRCLFFAAVNVESETPDGDHIVRLAALMGGVFGEGYVNVDAVLR